MDPAAKSAKDHDDRLGRRKALANSKLATATQTASSEVASLSYSKYRMARSISDPIPPAPTTPRIAALRTPALEAK